MHAKVPIIFPLPLNSSPNFCILVDILPRLCGLYWALNSALGRALEVLEFSTGVVAPGA